jgi:hypothetical protein
MKSSYMAEIGALFDFIFIWTTAGFTSQRAEQFFEANDVLRIPHPLYSADLVPSDFWLFARIKTALAGPNLMNQSNFCTQSANFWTQYRSKN